MINKYIILLTFIPWIIIFIISSIRNLNNNNYQNFTFKYLTKNFFKIFRLDTLFLIIVFFYFASFEKDFVNKYLFTVMNIYLCVNSIYEKKAKYSENFLKNNIFNFIILIIILTTPFIFYFIRKDLVVTYKIMLIYLFIEPLIIILINYISKLLKKIIK